MTICECIFSGREKLSQSDIQCADQTIQMKQIVEYVLGIDTKTLYLQWNERMPEWAVKKTDEMIDLRAKGHPFQYLTGVEWFWDHPFKVGPGVLIPRKETEILVEVVLREFPRTQVTFAELGAGSGNIGITLLKQRPNWSWRAFEIDPYALIYTKSNLQYLLPDDDRYQLCAGDFFEKIEKGPFDGIVANPPYVAEEEWNSLPKEVLHEPSLALNGGKEGLEVVSRLIDRAFDLLVPGGKLICEIDSRRFAQVKDRCIARGFENVLFAPDYSSQPRVLVTRKP